MVHYIDKEYQETKKIKLGLADFPNQFIEFAKEFETLFGIKPLHVVYEIMDHSNQPRLMICHENREDANQYYKNQFELLDDFEAKVIALFKAQQSSYPTLKTENMFVRLGSFKNIAIEEANESITDREIEELMQTINDPNLWTIRPQFFFVVFFLMTNDQVYSYQNSKKQEEWTDLYFNLLKSRDIFGYINREAYRINFESKENFDNLYQSNWSYYDRR